MEQMAFVQVEQGHGYLLPNTHYLGIIKHEFTLVKEIEKTALVDELCDHVEVRLMVKTHTHVKHHIGMPQLVEHFDFFDKIFECLFCQISLTESFNSDLSSHPFCLINISITSSSYEV